MKNFFKVFKLFLQFLKCLGCAYKNNCEHSLYLTYKGVSYLLTAKVVNQKKEGDK